MQICLACNGASGAGQQGECSQSPSGRSCRPQVLGEASARRSEVSPSVAARRDHLGQEADDAMPPAIVRVFNGTSGTSASA